MTSVSITADEMHHRAKRLSELTEAYNKRRDRFMKEVTKAANWMPRLKEGGREVRAQQYWHQHALISATAPFLTPSERWNLHNVLNGVVECVIDVPVDDAPSSTLGVFLIGHCREVSRFDEERVQRTCFPLLPRAHDLAFTATPPPTREYSYLCSGGHYTPSRLVVGVGPVSLEWHIVPTFDLGRDHEWSWASPGTEYYNAYTRSYFRLAKDGQTAYSLVCTPEHAHIGLVGVGSVHREWVGTMHHTTEPYTSNDDDFIWPNE